MGALYSTCELKKAFGCSRKHSTCHRSCCRPFQGTSIVLNIENSFLNIIPISRTLDEWSCFLRPLRRLEIKECIKNIRKKNPYSRMFSWAFMKKVLECSREHLTCIWSCCKTFQGVALGKDKKKALKNRFYLFWSFVRSRVLLRAFNL
jgi:hypothetical protein